MKTIAIVGSGFLGLTLALRLVESGHDVTVFESANEIGGLAGVWQIVDLIRDKNYENKEAGVYKLSNLLIDKIIQ